MNIVDKLLNKVKSLFGMDYQQPKKLPYASPISEYQVLDDPGMKYHLWRDQLNEQNAAKGNKPWVENYSLTDNAKIKSEPIKEVKSAKSIIPKAEASAKTNVDKSLQEIIKRGMEKYQEKAGKTVPVATMSAELAQAGEGLPHPLLPAIISLIETSGGVNQNRGINNIYNMLANSDKYRQGGGLNYPDLKTAILGGYNPQYDVESEGFRGNIMNHPAYKDYLESGDLIDFLEDFTPPADKNADFTTQLKRIDDLTKWYFSGN